MRLKNKKTGEIHEITEVVPLHDMDKKFVIYSKTEGHNHAYKNLAELNEEWTDAPEEPKEHWYIDWDGKLMVSIDEEGWERAIAIGNYFETKEEAEKAVERLCALKRLKDKGFSFEGWQDLEACDETERLVTNRIVDGENIIGFRMNDYHDCIKDLNICFGGEE